MPRALCFGMLLVGSLLLSDVAFGKSCAPTGRCDDSLGTSDADALALLQSQNRLPTSMQVDSRDVMPSWLSVPCYPNDTSKNEWLRFHREMTTCFRGFSQANADALAKSQYFCPQIRGNQVKQELMDKGGCANLGEECSYVEGPGTITGPWIKQEAVAEGAPGLYAEELQMHWNDPLYVYAEGPLRIANPPMNPFVNVNQLWESTSPAAQSLKRQRVIWGGQCPLAGEDEPGLQKPANTCRFLEFLKQNQVQVLVSLAPNQHEWEGAGIKCADFIWTRAGLGGNKADDVCGGLPYQVSEDHRWGWPIGNVTAYVVERTVGFAGHSFKQLYFDGWPDGWEIYPPPVPDPKIVKFIVDRATLYDRVVVACSAGRGRTGTLALGIVAHWQADGSPTTQLLVDELVKFRARRANMVEVPMQMMLLSPVFGLERAGETCPLNVRGP